jgi:hypothetical protein
MAGPLVLSWAYAACLALAYFEGCAFATPAAANRLMSSLNAAVIFVLAVCALAAADPITDAPPITGTAAAGMHCMCTFLAFDTVIGVAHGFESSPSLMLAHHALGLTAELISLGLGVGGYSTMVIHLAECSTPLLHLSWFMLTRGYSHTRIFVATGVSLVLLFGLSRVLLPFALLGLYLVTPAARAQWGGHDGVYCLHLVVVVGFLVLNCFWFGKLISKAKRSTAWSSKKSLRPVEGRPRC